MWPAGGPRWGRASGQSSVQGTRYREDGDEKCITHAWLTNSKANISCPLVAIHTRFLSLFSIFICLSPSLHRASSLVSHFSHRLLIHIMTRLSSHYSLFPHSPSPISFSSPPACLHRPPFVRGCALFFVVYCYRSVAHAATSTFHALLTLYSVCT